MAAARFRHTGHTVGPAVAISLLLILASMLDLIVNWQWHMM